MLERADGVIGEVAVAFNAFVEDWALVSELRRVDQVDQSVGFEGRTTERASLAAGGSWADRSETFLHTPRWRSRSPSTRGRSARRRLTLRRVGNGRERRGPGGEADPDS